MTQHDADQSPAQPAAAPDLSAASAFSHLALTNVIDWYRNADAKAQIILTLDGALVTFLTSSVFRKWADLNAITVSFSHRTWGLLIAMCLCLVGSILSALACLWSRIFLGFRRDSALGRERTRIQQGVTPYSPSVMLFFKTICWLDHDEYQRELGATDPAFHIKAFASQAYLLSERVYVKHVLINIGFILAGASLILFLASGASYLIEVKPPF